MEKSNVQDRQISAMRRMRGITLASLYRHKKSTRHLPRSLRLCGDCSNGTSWGGTCSSPVLTRLSCWPRFRWRTRMDEQRKYAILFAATILAARKLNEIGSKPCPARESTSRTQSTRPSSSSKRLIPPLYVSTVYADSVVIGSHPPKLSSA